MIDSDRQALRLMEVDPKKDEISNILPGNIGLPG